MYASYGARWRARGDSLSTFNTTAAISLFLYSRARLLLRTSSSIRLSLLVFFALALRLVTLHVSAGALLSSLLELYLLFTFVLHLSLL